MKRSDFDFSLPDELIAQHPPEKRGDSRLLCVNGSSGALQDDHFSSVLQRVGPDDLLVFNDTRVIPARLYGQKQTGGKVEILLERLLDEDSALAHIRASKSPRPGSQILLDQGYVLRVQSRRGSLFEIHCEEVDLLSVLKTAGHMPLPPYIARPDDADDSDRYQTVYARRDGAVAAPTAGLHFTESLLAALADKGVEMAFVTLHVGAGTFQPVRVENLDEHEMHQEWLDVSEEVVSAVARTRQKGGRVIAVGTTSVRSLESAALHNSLQAYTGETDLFIRPGFDFRVVDVLLTNFHLPQSTLLMLVSAFCGYENIMRAYRHAVQQRYRFFSYGDAMWLEKALSAP